MSFKRPLKASDSLCSITVCVRPMGSWIHTSICSPHIFLTLLWFQPARLSLLLGPLGEDVPSDRSNTAKQGAPWVRLLHSAGRESVMGDKDVVESSVSSALASVTSLDSLLLLCYCILTTAYWVLSTLYLYSGKSTTTGTLSVREWLSRL